MACTDPPSITGGSIITSAPYADGSLAVYTCNTGYVMSGTAYVTCNTGVWTTSPSCALQYQQNISVTNTDNTEFPNWLTYFIATVLVMMAILFLVCIIVCCFQLCGYYGEGGLFGHPLGCGYLMCCSCCRNKDKHYHLKRKTCTNYPRRYHYDEHGHRYHLDDLGRRCYYEHRNRNGRFVNVSSVTPETESSVHEISNTHYVNENHDRPLVEKKAQPAKELLTWKPHVHPVRNINTSTK